MEKKVIKNKAVIRSIIIICLIAAAAVGYKICDLILFPQYYIFGHVTEVEVSGIQNGPVKTDDRHTIDVLLSCISKARINAVTPAGVDALDKGYNIIFTFADGGKAEYQYVVQVSHVEPAPFKEFLDLISKKQ